MCNCDSAKNQTSKACFDFLEKHGADSLGLGLFLVPDPEAGVLEFRSIVVENIDLTETAKRGTTCVAFKFIPYGVELPSSDKITAIKITATSDLDKIYCGYNCTECYGPCWCSHWAGNCIRY